MVNKQHYQALQGGPPPLEESWWESILAEDEERTRISSPKHPAQAGPGSRMAAGTPDALEQVDWEKAAVLYEEDETVRLKVSGCNRGGLLVNGEDLQGFVPVSHLVAMPGGKSEAEQEQWLSAYIGRIMQLKVIECDEERGRIVFSERAALAEPGSRNQLLNTLVSGDCIQGTVTNITDFGVFVDLGGVEGLIHVSEISWGRVRHPGDVVRLGQPVEVYVIQVNQDKARVALSLKRLCPNPWETAQMRYFPGQVTEAVVTSVVPFGAFARLEEGLDGLIHVSEMWNGGPVANPTEVLREGQRVRVRVLHVDGSKQRLGLSMRLSDQD